MTEAPTPKVRTVTLDGATYEIIPTAFRSHYQVMASDGQLLGLIEMVDTSRGRRCTARPASGTGMTLMLMNKIAELATSSGILK